MIRKNVKRFSEQIMRKQSRAGGESAGGFSDACESAVLSRADERFPPSFGACKLLKTQGRS
jgi:hypothetical protein